jgi:hypothetical protein
MEELDHDLSCSAVASLMGKSEENHRKPKMKYPVTTLKFQSPTSGARDKSAAKSTA